MLDDATILSDASHSVYALCRGSSVSASAGCQPILGRRPLSYDVMKTRIDSDLKLVYTPTNRNSAQLQNIVSRGDYKCGRLILRGKYGLSRVAQLAGSASIGNLSREWIEALWLWCFYRNCRPLVLPQTLI